jgi:hypothetical protein
MRSFSNGTHHQLSLGADHYLETGHVFYSRTYDHSSMAVASNDVVPTPFRRA